MAGQIKDGTEKQPWRREVARANGSFTRPDLVIPCRVASPQSPTPLPWPGVVGLGQFFRRYVKVQRTRIDDLQMVVVHGYTDSAAGNGVIAVA
jgi:hypothetical protein